MFGLNISISAIIQTPIKMINFPIKLINFLINMIYVTPIPESLFFYFNKKRIMFNIMGIPNL